MSEPEQVKLDCETKSAIRAYLITFFAIPSIIIAAASYLLGMFIHSKAEFDAYKSTQERVNKLQFEAGNLSSQIEKFKEVIEYEKKKIEAISGEIEKSRNTLEQLTRDITVEKIELFKKVNAAVKDTEQLNAFLDYKRNQLIIETRPFNRLQMGRNENGFNVQSNPNLPEHTEIIRFDREVLAAGLTLNKAVNRDTLEEVSYLTAQLNPDDTKSVIVRCRGKRAGRSSEVPVKDMSITGSVWAVLKGMP